MTFLEYETAMDRGAEVFIDAVGGPVFGNSVVSREKLRDLIAEAKIGGLHYCTINSAEGHMNFAFELRDYAFYRRQEDGDGLSLDLYHAYQRAAENLIAMLEREYEIVDATCLESPDGQPSWAAYEEYTSS